MKKSPPPPEVIVRQAVSSLRTVGTVFVLLGGAISLLYMQEITSRPALGLVLVASTTVFLLGPGVLYHLTALLLRRHDVGVAWIARQTAIAQSVLTILGVGTTIAANLYLSRTPFDALMHLLVPAIVTAFFVPALLAQAYQIGKALQALRLISESQRGFEVMAVIPTVLDHLDVSPSPGTPGQGGGEGGIDRRTISDTRNHPHPDPFPEYRERELERNKPNDSALVIPIPPEDPAGDAPSDAVQKQDAT
jgi:hypothetical protein